MKTYPVAILGANGTVGQKIIALLSRPPFCNQFEVAEVAASEGRVGKTYLQEVDWREPLELPAKIKALKFIPLTEVQSPLVISALPADVALQVEPHLAQKGKYIFSNASAMRMESHVPLLIPEINSNHLAELLKRQTTPGKIITNPNCSTVFLAMAVAPLMKLAKLNHISATTLQALSGAGLPGVASLDIVGNLIPYIGDEEEKIVRETKKILGEIDRPLATTISVQVNRVPIQHGHTISLHLEFDSPVTPEQIKSCFEEWNKKHPQLFKIHEENNRPQPLRDLHAYDFIFHIGRIKQGDAPHRISLISLGHNLVRGAAGAAILNMISTLPLIKI